MYDELDIFKKYVKDNNIQSYLTYQLDLKNLVKLMTKDDYKNMQETLFDEESFETEEESYIANLILKYNLNQNNFIFKIHKITGFIITFHCLVSISVLKILYSNFISTFAILGFQVILFIPLVSIPSFFAIAFTSSVLFIFLTPIFLI